MLYFEKAASIEDFILINQFKRCSEFNLATMTTDGKVNLTDVLPPFPEEVMIFE